MAHYQIATCTADGSILEIEDQEYSTFEDAAKGLGCYVKVGPNLWENDGFARVVEYA